MSAPSLRSIVARGRPPAVRALLGRSTVRTLAGLLALLTVGLVGACSSGSTNSTSSTNAQSGEIAKDPLAAGDAGKAGANGSPAGGGTAARVDPTVRSIVYTAAVSVTVADVVKAADSATTTVVAAGGIVSADNRTLDADRSEAHLTLRVPTAAFSATVHTLAGLGTEVSRTVTTQDVTQDLVDVDARLATQKASVARVRALLSEARSIGDIVSIESELTRREADLDSLEQRKATLGGLVALSTINLDLRGSGAAPPPVVHSDSGFVAGLRSGWSAFISSARVFLTVLGWLLPWIIVVAVPTVLLLRRNRRRRVASSVSSPSSSAPPPGGSLPA